MKYMRNVLHKILADDLESHEVTGGARIGSGLSQDEVADITGIQRPNLSALENGRTPMTSHYAEILGVVYGLHPADILYPNRKLEKSTLIIEIEKKAELVKREKKVS